MPRAAAGKCSVLGCFDPCVNLPVGNGRRFLPEGHCLAQKQKVDRNRGAGDRQGARGGCPLRSFRWVGPPPVGGGLGVGWGLPLGGAASPLHRERPLLKA